MADEIIVYELKLEQDGSPSKEKKYIRLPPPTKPYIFRLSLNSGSLASRQGVLFTNCPQGQNEYNRAKFWQYELPSSIGKVAHIDLLIEHAGAFEYYVEHAAPLADIPYPTKEVPIAKQADKEAPRESSEHGYFVIEPILDLPCRSQILDTKTNGILPPGKGGDIGSKNQSLSQDGIVLQSFMAKWAGTMSEWTPHLEEASRNGYNMIHYLPLQVRGESNSPYSIAEQDDFAQDLFDAKTGKSSTKQERQATLAQYLKSIKQKYGLLSMVDVVLNHTANNSEWLNDHPEAAYSPYNSPHLTPAEELDRALQEYSNRLGSLGLPTDPKSQSDVDAIVQGIKTHVIDPLRLWEYYAVNVESGKQDFAKAWDSNKSSNVTSLGTDNLTSSSEDDAFQLLNKHGLRNYLAMSERYTTHIDVNVAVAVMKGLYKESPSKETVVEAFGNVLNKVNVNLYAIYDDDVSAILSNISIRLAYFRIEEGGPKLGPITPSSPFCESYFTRLSPDHPSAKKHGADPKRMALANNGWIYNSDPLLDFASNQCRVYLRREVIAWVDCVKLRYGKKPSDCPFLWKHMEQYCVTAATLFDGFRIDNCHSTPMVVGEYFLDVARKANKNLYVCAELFTGSEDLDILFVSKLGINSLIRELTNGPDPVEESRLLYRFGVNKPIGSMDVDCLSTRTKVVVHGGAKKTPIDCTVVPLGGSSPHALFMDLTHDNETPTKLRTPEDHITMAALIAFSYSAIGSNKGFDDVFPDQLNVVSEKRRYEIPVGNEDRGIGAVRRVFNHLHQEMATNGYSEGHVHQEKDYIMMHRIHPQTHEGYLVLAHTAFTKGASGRGEVNPFKFNRTKLQYIMGKTLKITDREPSKDGKILHGLPSKLIDIPSPPIKEGTDDDGFYSELTAPDEFPPGSIMLFSTYMDGLGDDLGTLCQSGAEDAMSSLDLVDLNVVLYRADAEERDATGGNDGAYTIPNLGPLVYCGTEGWMAHLKHITRSNDLGHPLCDHLRKGPWALDYVHNRLERQVKLFPNLAKTAEWFKVRFDKIRETAPSFLRPKYFALVLVTASRVARQRAISQMSDFVKEGDDFTQSLALCAVQMNGQVQSSSLWHDRPSASMAAGLPFFATSWARLWGRDVFISLRGLYLTTQMSQAAKEHILSFGCTLWNGLIPNLLNSTTNPRYNCRDGPWFFAQNIQDYVRKVPGGEAILQEKIKRRFPLDGEWVEVDSSKAFSQTSTLAEILQEILQRHASGIHFREHNAGPDIDGDMTDNGFNIDIEVDWKTGFVMGGNPDNCGTWQDKMGSSAKAKNKGVPGSSREGAAVEITGLLKSTLRWVDELSGKGKWHAKGVKAKIDGSETEISFRKWGDLIQAAFEKNYWVPLDSSEDSSYNVKTSLINRRGIYKDVFGSSAGREWCDYQLRANFPMAMCVAPELFDASHAVTALQAADHALRDTIGMKTLDPNDRNFHGVYDNSNDTDDYWMAKGFCYHNGPPWIFPFGFFLRAFLIFDQKAGSGTISKTNTWWRAMSMLGAHRRHIETSPWAGLPELTNADGQECSDSCPTQAWSASTILDALELVREQSQAM